MMGIFLGILKIIGIILLSILILILTVVALVLFAPIRYRGSIEKKGDFMAHARASYLGILRAEVSYDKELKYRVSVFWHDLVNSAGKASEDVEGPEADQKKTEADKAKKEKPDRKKKDNSSDSTREADKEALTSSKKGDDKTSGPSEENNEKKSDAADAGNEESSDSSEGDSAKKQKNNKFKQLYDKIIKLVERVKKDKAVLTSEPVKSFLKSCRKELLAIIKSLLPKKIKGLVNYSFESPDTTAYIYAAYSFIYPLLPDKLTVNPDFSREETEVYADVKFRGSVTVFSLLLPLARLYFNKNFKTFMKAIKEL